VEAGGREGGGSMSVSLPPKEPNVAALVLLRFMSLLSEEWASAQWLMGLEYGLWSEMMHVPSRLSLYDGLCRDDAAALAWLAHEAGGWWYRDDDAGAQFTDLGSWQAEYDRAKVLARKGVS
jgi:hypothetical protein